MQTRTKLFSESTLNQMSSLFGVFVLRNMYHHSSAVPLVNDGVGGGRRTSGDLRYDCGQLAARRCSGGFELH